MKLKTIFKNIVVLSICLAMVLSVSMPSAFAYSYATNSGVIRFEAEENDVYTDYNGGNAAIIVDANGASGKQYVREQLSKWHWYFTPDYTGYYRFEIFVSAGAGNNYGNLAGDATSTFKVGGVNVYTGEILGTLDGTNWDVTKGRVTKLGGEIELTAGVEYKLELTFGGKTCQRVIDYFDIYYNSMNKPETDIYLNAVDDFDRWAGRGVGWYDSSPNSYDPSYVTSDPDFVDLAGNECGWTASLWLLNGDWFRYTVDIPVAGYYRVFLGLRTCKANYPLRVTVNDDEYSDVTVSRSQSMSNWIGDVKPFDNAGLFYFNQGSNTIKVATTHSSCDAVLNSIRIVSADISLLNADKEVAEVNEGTYEAMVNVTDYYSGVTHNSVNEWVPWSAEDDGTINKICVVAAVYNGTEVVRTYVSDAVDKDTSADDSNLKDYTITVNDIEVEDGEKVKIFVWDATDAKPLTDFIEYK